MILVQQEINLLAFLIQGLFINKKISIKNHFLFFRFPKGIHIDAFRLVSVLGRGHFGKVNS